MSRPKRALYLVFALLAAACAPAPPATAGAGGEGAATGNSAVEGVPTEARAASMALVEAMNAHQPDSILSFYSLDDGFTYVGCTNFVFDGPTFETIIRGYHLSNPDVRYDMSVQALRVLGPDLAVVALQGTSSPDVALFTTRMLHRGEGGRWLVVWEHESWPGCGAPSEPHPGTVSGNAATAGPGGKP